MKTAVWLPLAALCLHGQETSKFAISLLTDQMNPAVSVNYITLSEGQSIKYENSIRPLRGLALRVSQEVLQAGPGFVSFDATYRFRTRSASRHLVNGEPNPYPSLTNERVGYRYLAVGGGWNFRRALEGGIGAEARMEGLDRRREYPALEPGRPAFTTEDQSHLVRPWLRVHVARNLTGVRFHPFLRAEAAWALTSRKPPKPAHIAPDTDLRPLAPQFQIALAGGIRL